MSNRFKPGLTKSLTAEKKDTTKVCVGTLPHIILGISIEKVNERLEKD